MSWRAAATGPAALAVLVTLGNAGKPPVVDDTAYLLFARHLSAHPLDPYGWELFWYRQPEPAMAVLLPPVLPYWLAAGVAMFGEHPVLLKLWLFPWVWLLARSAWALLARFAPGWQRPGTVLLLLGPAMLPLINFMLDVPAAALGLAAAAAFVRGCEAGDWRRVAVAGVLAGLAMQTKYTALTVPAVLTAFAVRRGRVRPLVGVLLLAGGLFVGWEHWLHGRYGESHFVHHVRDQSNGPTDRLARAAGLVRPLAAQLGGLAAAWGLLAAATLGVGRRTLIVGAGLLAAGYGAVAVVPGPDAVLVRSATGRTVLDLPGLVFLPAGFAVLVLAGGVGVRQCRTPDGRFLVAWLLVETVGYFALTPFPASRRVVPVVLPLGLLIARAVANGPRPVPRWPVGFGVACGVGLLALDAWDARVEPAGVDAAAAIIGDPGRHAVWTQGHWGWQYAADRRGWTLLDPGRSRIAAGDWVVLPVEPDAAGFHRPYHSGAKVAVDPTVLVPAGEWAWADRLAGQTVPNLYGGVYPVVGRTHPRLRVRVFRAARDWTPATAGTP